MIKRFSFLAYAAVLALACSAPAKAGSVTVSSDAGTGYVNVANAGGAGGPVVVTTATSPPTWIDSVNGAAVTPLLPLSITESITGYAPVGPGFVDVITSGTGSKTISDADGDTVTLTFSITSGVVSDQAFYTAGKITGATGSTDVGGYDFFTMVGGTVAIGIQKDGANFNTLFNSGGSVKTAGMSMSQSVPEPTSMALLGIGMTGFLAFRRLFRRNSVA